MSRINEANKHLFHRAAMEGAVAGSQAIGHFCCGANPKDFGREVISAGKGASMKFLASMIVLLALLTSAVAKDRNPASYPGTAHVVSAYFIHEWVTQIQVGKIVYVLGGVCNAAKVGKDYPARLDEKSWKVEARFRLLVRPDKVCTYSVKGSQEAQ